jgi:hypothetical protein
VVHECTGAQVHGAGARVRGCTGAAAGVHRRARARVDVAVLVALTALGCARSEEKAPEIHAAAPVEAAERPVLAESANQAASLGVQVLDARRIAPDTVRLDLALVNRLPVTAGVPEADGLHTAMSALEGMSLVSHEGHRRVFPLRDTAGRMVWSGVEAPPPGERRQLWVCFPAPAGERPRVALVLPGWPAMKAVEVRQAVK